MNVISSNSSLQGLLMQPKLDLQTLQTDLNSGNLAGAQKDFAAFQQDALNMFQNSSNKTTQGLNQTGPSQMASDFQALQSALGSGNIADAQKAFAAFQQDAQTKTMPHRYHHHHQEDANQAQNSNTNAQSSTTAPPSDAAGNPTGVAALLASLLTAYQSSSFSNAASLTGATFGVTG